MNKINKTPTQGRT